MAENKGLDCVGLNQEQRADLFVKKLYSLNHDLNIHIDFKAKGIDESIVNDFVEGVAKVTCLLNNNLNVTS